MPTSYVVEPPGGEQTVARPLEPRAPGPAEVTIAVAGSALGQTLGAEISGQVVATGAAAAEWLGRRVVAPRVLPCGECDLCRRGRTTGCALRAERSVTVVTHETVPARYLLSVEPPLWPASTPLWQLAALADAASTPYQALVRAQLGPGDLLVVVGATVRGCLAIAIGRALGANVVAIDADPRRRERASLAGARLVLDGAALDAAAARAALLADATAAGLRTVEAKVLEATATAAGRRRALELCGPGDTAALLDGADRSDGNTACHLADALAAACATEAQVVTAAACHPDLLPELAALLVRGDLTLEPHVAALPFTTLGATLAAVRRGTLLGLPILVPDPE